VCEGTAGTGLPPQGNRADRFAKAPSSSSLFFLYHYLFLYSMGLPQLSDFSVVFLPPINFFLVRRTEIRERKFFCI